MGEAKLVESIDRNSFIGLLAACLINVFAMGLPILLPGTAGYHDYGQSLLLLAVVVSLTSLALIWFRAGRTGRKEGYFAAFAASLVLLLLLAGATIVTFFMFAGI